MHSLKPTTQDSFFHRLRRMLLPKKGQVPPELQQAINDCSTIQQLLALLFSTDFIIDEAILDAFDKRMDELDSIF
jgi:hypothetical protein